MTFLQCHYPLTTCFFCPYKTRHFFSTFFQRSYLCKIKPFVKWQQQHRKVSFQLIDDLTTNISRPTHKQQKHIICFSNFLSSIFFQSKLSLSFRSFVCFLSFESKTIHLFNPPTQFIRRSNHIFLSTVANFIFHNQTQKRMSFYVYKILLFSC